MSPTPWYLVDDLAEAIAIAGHHGDRMIVDIDHTLVRYSATGHERRQAMEASIRAVAEHGGIRRLAFISNARVFLPRLGHAWLEVWVVRAARKPHVHLAPLRELREDFTGAAVYGDMPLTDGMLARNLDGIWIQPRHTVAPPTEPWWPWLLRRVGRRTVQPHLQLTPTPELRPGPATDDQAGGPPAPDAGAGCTLPTPAADPSAVDPPAPGPTGADPAGDRAIGGPPAARRAADPAAPDPAGP